MFDICIHTLLYDLNKYIKSKIDTDMQENKVVLMNLGEEDSSDMPEENKIIMSLIDIKREN